MRKILTFIAGTLITGSVMAGGLVTNNNQSVMFTRLQNRNASTGIDAVFFNPAGLTKLGDGFFVSINNQTIGQKKTVGNNYQYLQPTPKDFIGKVSAPVFPGVYVAFNTGKLSFSAGFNPIGGGGGAKYDKGLPSFEMGVADLIPSLAAGGITATKYAADIFFEGTSVYFGYQANAAYKINDMFSAALGVRLVTAKETYDGYLKNISINPNYPAFGANFNGTNMVLARDFFTAGGTFLTGLATGATAYSGVIAGRIGTGVPAGTLLSNGATNGLNATQIGTIQTIMGAAGQTPAQIGAATLGYAQAVLTGAAPVFTTKATGMTVNAAKTQDVIVEAQRTGTGYTPILSVNFSPSDKLNFAVKYEFKTELELITKVTDNKGGGVFTDGEKIIADMPAILFVGAEVRPIDKLMLAGSFNYYFDKNVDYDGLANVNINMIDHNFLEFGLGAEYGLSEKFRISAGWLATLTGVNSNYQSDQTYSTNTNSFGAGFGYRITPMIDLNIGGQYTLYDEGTKDFTHPLGTVNLPVTETYNKTTWLVGAGLDFYFGKK